MLNELTIPSDIPMIWQDRAERLRVELVKETWADDLGALHWCSNDAPVPLDVFRDAFVEPPTSQKAVRDQHTTEFLAEYRRQNADRPLSGEDRFEMLAAFGPGETVVDLITGQKWET